MINCRIYNEGYHISGCKFECKKHIKDKHLFIGSIIKVIETNK